MSGFAIAKWVTTALTLLTVFVAWHFIQADETSDAFVVLGVAALPFALTALFAELERRHRVKGANDG
jgi:hypothetical protein